MKIVLIIPVLLICTGVTASEYRSDFPVFLQDTIIHTDSLTFTGKEEVLKSKARKRDNGKPHSPHRATIMAMVLPGSGQIYNRQWWKLPILYGGIGATVYGLSWNMKYYKKYRTAFVDYTAYLNALEADPDVVIADTARHAGSGTSFGYLTKMVASEQEASASDPTGGNGASFCYIHKQKDGRDIYFFTNSSNDSISTLVSLRGRLKLQRWDPFTGETTGLASRRERRSGGTYTHFELDLPPVSGVFVVGERRE